MKLIAYGSLMNDLLNHGLEGVPVFVPDVMRVYDLAAYGSVSTYGLAANARIMPGEVMVAVVFTLPDDLVPVLDRREAYYGRIRVMTYSWPDGSALPHPDPVDIYVATPATSSMRLQGAGMPGNTDLHLAREGVLRVGGQKLLRAFYGTTYLADGMSLEAMMLRMNRGGLVEACHMCGKERSEERSITFPYYPGERQRCKQCTDFMSNVVDKLGSGTVV